MILPSHVELRKKYGGAIVAIKLSSDLMDGQPITEVTLYNVKAREGDADRACSQFQNVFARISNCIFPNCEIHLSKLQMSIFNNASPSLHLYIAKNLFLC